MTPLVAVAVLVAALTHASWNALAHTIKDQLVAFTLIGGGAAVIGAVLACFTPLPHPAAWPYLVVSALLHIGYQALLMRSFSLGDFGQMYPIARGTAPLVVTVLAAVFVGESLDARQAAGVVVASAGLVGLALWGIRGSGSTPHWPALLAALATGLSIAAYTVVDGVGVRDSGSPLGYIAWLMILEGLMIPAYALYARRGLLLAQLRPHAARGLLGAVLSMLAYGLVLWAQTRAALAPIAALRESSILVGAAIGAVFFKERFGTPRIAAAGLMVVGIGLMLHAG
ncbi:DMT family transporter [Streptomyces scopuliridis]|uniref:Membrane protein n=1 Tax=Streptomyces scopuliridis RB72 TaxID=1440053 RepID=A0A2T7T6G9_9ACTN|nr:DMT family transporter [Streptomyces scopuliridis]PVE10701.1 membrane protein [Streptomyces scopuliridis RB72]